MNIYYWYRQQPTWYRRLNRLFLLSCVLIGVISGHYYYVQNYRVWYEMSNDAAKYVETLRH